MTPCFMRHIFRTLFIIVNSGIFMPIQPFCGIFRTQCNSCIFKALPYSESGISTIIHNMFETNFSFHLKQRTTGKVQFLLFRRFLLLPTKFSFLEKDLALYNNFMKF